MDTPKCMSTSATHIILPVRITGTGPVREDGIHCMNETEKTLSVYEVVQITRDQLGNIDVPVKYKHISDGIYTAIGNLNAILDAITRDNKNETEE